MNQVPSKFPRRRLRALAWIATAGCVLIWGYLSWNLFSAKPFGPNFSGPVPSRIRLQDPKTFRLAVLSDNHANFKVLSVLLRDAKARGADAVVFLGDLADNGGYISFSAVSREVEQMVPGLPVFSGFGNHDQDTFARPAVFEKFFGPTHFWWRYGRALFIMINNITRDQWDHELAWLGDTLRAQARPGDQVFLMMHKAPYLNAEAEGMPQGQSAALLKVIAPYPGLQILAGHEHAFRKFNYQGFPVWVSGDGGGPQKTDPPAYGYLFLTCPETACRLEHLELGFIPDGWLARKRLMLDSYWLWPGLALALAAVMFYAHKKGERKEPIRRG